MAGKTIPKAVKSDTRNQSKILDTCWLGKLINWA